MTATTAAQRKAAKRARRPIYLQVARLVDPRTGEEIGALVPANGIDQRLLRERKFTVGKEIRAELKQSRNPAFHRLAHAVGNLLADNVEAFRDLTAHEALKAVQLEAGVCCFEREIDATPVISAVLAAAEAVFGAGAAKLLRTVLPEVRTVKVKEARSLAFDEMAEDEFRGFFEGITAYIAEHYAGVMLDEVRGEFWEMVNGGGA